jgi:hypothetical protein
VSCFISSQTTFGSPTIFQRLCYNIPDTFLSFLPLGGEIKVGIIDYIIKTLGGALTFGLLAIALRGKFERNIHGSHKGYVIITTSYFSCS